MTFWCVKHGANTRVHNSNSAMKTTKQKYKGLNSKGLKEKEKKKNLSMFFQYRKTEASDLIYDA